MKLAYGTGRTQANKFRFGLYIYTHIYIYNTSFSFIHDVDGECTKNLVPGGWVWGLAYIYIYMYTYRAVSDFLGSV